MSIKPSDLAALGIGFLTGDAVADAVSEETSIASVATGFVAGGIGTSVAKSIMQETGVADVLDDLFDIF
jgi:hypothetical protein